MNRRQGQPSGRRTLLAGILLCLAPVTLSGDETTLIRIFSDTYGSRWTQSTGWTTGSVCEWFGVRCAPSTQSVETLDLPGNALEGELPDLSQLNSLHRLSLPLNSITGHFPNISGASGLKYVDLSINSMTGQLPDWIGSLASLSVLNISYNRFAGPAPQWLEALLNTSSPSMLVHVDNNCFTFSSSLMNPPYQRTQSSVCNFGPHERSPNGLPLEAILGICAAILLACLAFIVYWRSRPAVMPMDGTRARAARGAFDELNEVPSPQPA